MFDIQVQHAGCGGIYTVKQKVNQRYILKDEESVCDDQVSLTFRFCMPDVMVQNRHTFKDEESVFDTQVQHARHGGVCTVKQM